VFINLAYSGMSFVLCLINICQTWIKPQTFMSFFEGWKEIFYAKIPYQLAKKRKKGGVLCLFHMHYIPNPHTKIIANFIG
jgi:hypothetical protein